MKESKKKNGNLKAPEKLMILVTIVDRRKTEFYLDVLTGYEVNLQTVAYGYGTAPVEFDVLGLGGEGKAVIFSVIKKSNVKSALEALDEKFKTIRHGKGIAYTLPINSMIGVYIYQFLSNQKDTLLGEAN
ncbi:MAG: hypothetical protein E7180_00510 [Erysipelotrichaceae bacterium]|nr:hypothetical protein [Erysipelotrichaceae bacterium]